MCNFALTLRSGRRDSISEWIEYANSSFEVISSLSMHKSHPPTERTGAGKFSFPSSFFSCHFHDTLRLLLPPGGKLREGRIGGTKKPRIRRNKTLWEQFRASSAKSEKPIARYLFLIFPVARALPAFVEITTNGSNGARKKKASRDTNRRG